MTVLADPRHERLAQAIATGKTLHLASRLAGYINPAYELARHPVIKERVKQILEAAASAAVMEAREWQERETRRARVDVREFFSVETGRMLPMKEWSDEATEAVESIGYDKYGQMTIKLAKSGAMNNLGKMHKLLTDKVELSGNVSSTVRAIHATMTPQEAAEAYAALLSPGA